MTVDKTMIRFSFFMPLFLLSGCAYQPITVQTEYITHESLASYYVGTPDPRLKEPLVGQRLIICWSLPSSNMSKLVKLYLKVRFRNREEEERLIEIQRSSGSYIYNLEGNQFCEKKGILTYKIEIRDNNGIITKWQHQLWSELIEVKVESSLSGKSVN